MRWTALYLLAACAANDPDPEIDEIADSKADGMPFPLGTYREGGGLGNVGELNLLVLKTDDTFFFNRVCYGDECSYRAGGYAGGYRFTRWHDRRYIRFYEASGELIARFQYAVFDDSSIAMVNVAELDWNLASQLVPDDVLWCAEDEDCALQGHPSGTGLACVDAACIVEPP